MSIREYTDSNGVVWRVWTTIPSNVRSVNAELSSGWLTFDSVAERRRLGPIPKGWEEMSPERLEFLCRVAVPARSSDPYGIAAQAGDDSTNDRR